MFNFAPKFGLFLKCENTGEYTTSYTNRFFGFTYTLTYYNNFPTVNFMPGLFVAIPFDSDSKTYSNYTIYETNPTQDNEVIQLVCNISNTKVLPQILFIKDSEAFSNVAAEDAEMGDFTNYLILTEPPRTSTNFSYTLSTYSNKIFYIRMSIHVLSSFEARWYISGQTNISTYNERTSTNLPLDFGPMAQYNQSGHEYLWVGIGNNN